MTMENARDIKNYLREELKKRVPEWRGSGRVTGRMSEGTRAACGCTETTVHEHMLRSLAANVARTNHRVFRHSSLGGAS